MMLWRTEPTEGNQRKTSKETPLSLYLKFIKGQLETVWHCWESGVWLDHTIWEEHTVRRGIV